MATYKLENRDGSLYLKGEICLYRYAAGDVDSLPWPLKSDFRSAEKLKHQLAICVMDMHETGAIEFHPNATEIVIKLPNGKVFDWVNHLADLPPEPDMGEASEFYYKAWDRGLEPVEAVNLAANKFGVKPADLAKLVGVKLPKAKKEAPPVVTASPRLDEANSYVFEPEAAPAAPEPEAAKEEEPKDESDRFGNWEVRATMASGINKVIGYVVQVNAELARRAAIFKYQLTTNEFEVSRV